MLTCIFFLSFSTLMQVDRHCAHFFGVTISDQQAQAGIVIRVTSAVRSKFKVYKIEKLFQTT